MVERVRQDYVKCRHNSVMVQFVQWYVRTNKIVTVLFLSRKWHIDFVVCFNFCVIISFKVFVIHEMLCIQKIILRCILNKML